MPVRRVMRQQILELQLATMFEVAGRAADARGHRSRLGPGAETRVVAAVLQRTDQVAEVREVGRQLPSGREHLFEPNVAPVARAGDGSGCAIRGSGALQELGVMCP